MRPDSLSWLHIVDAVPAWLLGPADTDTKRGTGFGRGATEARTESQTSPFSEGIWQDGGQVYDVHPGGEGADKETREQVRERAKQDAERG